MKNVIIGAFMLACTLTATAQTDINAQKTQPTATTAQPTTATPAQQLVTTTATAQPQQEDDGYNKVTQNEIAPAVLNKAVEKYQGYKLVEALVAEDGTNYKLVLTKDGKDIAAYYKNNGEFIKEETV